MRILASVFPIGVVAALCGCNPDRAKDSTDDVGDLGKHVQRGKEARSVQNDMRQLATFLFDPEKGRTPKNWEEFKPTIRQAPNIVKEIEEGQINVLWNTPLSSNTIVAYEVQEDIRGTHIVAMDDGSVHTMTTVQF